MCTFAAALLVLFLCINTPMANNFSENTADYLVRQVILYPLQATASQGKKEHLLRSKEVAADFKVGVPVKCSIARSRPFLAVLSEIIKEANHLGFSLVFCNCELIQQLEKSVKRRFFLLLSTLEGPLKFDDESFDLTDLKAWSRFEYSSGLLGERVSELFERRLDEEIDFLQEKIAEINSKYRKKQRGLSVAIASYYQPNMVEASRIIAENRALDKNDKAKMTGVAIADFLNNKGVTTAQGGIWDQPAVSRFYKDKVGKILPNFNTNKVFERELRKELEKDALMFITEKTLIKNQGINVPLNLPETGGKKKQQKTNYYPITVGMEYAENRSEREHEKFKEVFTVSSNQEKVESSVYFLQLFDNQRNIVYECFFYLNQEVKSWKTSLWTDAQLMPGKYYYLIRSTDDLLRSPAESQFSVNDKQKEIEELNRLLPNRHREQYAPIFDQITLGGELLCREKVIYPDGFKPGSKVVAYLRTSY